jgi:hypothetical protein
MGRFAKVLFECGPSARRDWIYLYALMTDESWGVSEERPRRGMSSGKRRRRDFGRRSGEVVVASRWGAAVKVGGDPDW